MRRILLVVPLALIVSFAAARLLQVSPVSMAQSESNGRDNKSQTVNRGPGKRIAVLEPIQQTKKAILSDSL